MTLLYKKRFFRLSSLSVSFFVLRDQEEGTKNGNFVNINSARGRTHGFRRPNKRFFKIIFGGQIISGRWKGERRNIVIKRGFSGGGSLLTLPELKPLAQQGPQPPFEQLRDIPRRKRAAFPAQRGAEFLMPPSPAILRLPRRMFQVSFHKRNVRACHEG